MGLTKTSSAAINLLIDIGYFPVHVNLDLLKLRIKTDYGDEVLLASENLLMGSDDPDGVSVYAGYTSMFILLCITIMTLIYCYMSIE